MKLEKLKTSNNKYKYIVIGVIIVASILTLINILPSKASYRNTESIPLVTGTINYKLPDINVIAMYKTENGQQTEITELPGAGYEIDTENSYCYTTDPKVHDDVTLATDSAGNLVIGKLKKGSKCYLYFVKESLSKKTLAKLESAKGSSYTITELTAPFEKDGSDSTNKLYSYPENGDKTYVFRGSVTDNWLRFGGKTWRIIRINSDGTLRIIYQCGTENCTTETGSETQIGKSAYKTSPYNDNTYVGYYYGEAGAMDYTTTHESKQENPSTIATAVTNWYNSNLKSYTSKISGSTGFCNDRRLSSGTGTGTTPTYYKAHKRFYNKRSVTPDLSCDKNDLYTLKGDAGSGNGVLKVPAALITADEVALAGMIYGSNNAESTNWLYTNQYYWTMSPFVYYSSSGIAAVFLVRDSGYLDNGHVDGTRGVRPVINLKANISITGKGTSTEPFIAT